MTSRALAVVVTLAVVVVGSAAAGAQPATRVSRIGYLGPSAPAVEGHLLEAFRQELRNLGYTEGQNLTIAVRWAEGQEDRLPALAAELVRLNPDVIVTSGTQTAVAAKQATSTIPIVMTTAGDAVRTGLATSLARPGGNVTGYSILAPELAEKRLDLLKQVVPTMARVGVLWNPANPGTRPMFERTEATASAIRVTLEPVVGVRRIEEFEPAFGTISRVRPDALIVIGDRFLLAQRARIVTFAAEHRFPAIYAYPEYVDAGGLLAYAPDNVALFRGAAVYVDKILKGAKVAELPIQQPTKIDLVINLRTAKAIGLTIPPSVLIQATRVVE
jgi:putative ABC transport system substrate-binding protein